MLESHPIPAPRWRRDFRLAGVILNLPLSCLLLTSLLLRPSLGAESGTNGLRLPTIQIPYSKFVLSNGLTLIIHEDHKAAIVAVNVWYHVGSKNEPPGKTGFAHLFEHLMFNGSEHFNDDYFKAMEMVGATSLNGTTSEDRTDYFENAPKEALDFVLWMESDRMGYLLGAIDQAKLDEQRGVVQNEKRQGENQPYGLAEELIVKGSYPPYHPYGHTVIGSMEDLNAASLEDVKDWFRKYYGPANATLVIAGDVDPQAAREKAEKYFGAIPPGPPVVHNQTWVAPRQGKHRELAQDRVPLARIYKVWNVPEYGAADADYLNLASDVLATGKTSRLYKRLVYDEQIATQVSASIDESEIGSRFTIMATARPGVPLERVEKAIDEEMTTFLAKGPTNGELQRVKTEFFASFLRSLERIGGFGGKSDILAMNQVFKGTPDFYQVTLQHVGQATADNLRHAADKWLSDGEYVLEIHPFPDYVAGLDNVDRSKLPVPALAPEVKFPELQQATLTNGMKIIVAERHALPLVTFALQLDAGYAADGSAAPGAAKLAMDMLDEGTKKHSSLEISETLSRLGATLGTASDLDTSTIQLSALKTNLDASLEVLADVVLHPAFPQSDFDRLKNQQLDTIRREKSEPTAMALRVLPRLLYGEGHAYAIPFTGSGTAEAVAKLTPADARKFHETWFRPNNATLIVVGDTTLGEMRPKLEKLFSGWAQGPVPQKHLGQVNPATSPVLYLMDRPGALQSVVFAGELAPPRNNPQETAIEVMNHILGGTFTSRINMNLREDKHWSYGARTMLVPARGDRPFLVLAPVQTDKTKESIVELEKELRGIVGQHPVQPEELAKAKQDMTLKLSGAWETSAQVVGAIEELVRFHLPHDYYTTYPGKVLAANLPEVRAAAKEVVVPQHETWVVIGDRQRIEPGLKSLGLGAIRLIDSNGNPIKSD